jgi:predicted PurR-regulated permease PerM
LDGEKKKDLRTFDLKARDAVVIGAVILVILVALWKAAQVFLVIFAGIVLAVLLDSLASLLHKWVKLPRGLGIALVLLGGLGVAVGIGFLVAPRIAEQAELLSKQLPQALDHLLEDMKQVSWLQPFAKQIENIDDDMMGGGHLLSRTTGVLSSVFGTVFSVFVGFMLGLYISAEPKTYERGIVHLVPLSRRERARDIMGDLSHTMRWWLISKAISMAIVGVLSGIGLWALGIPLALTLALITALLTFVPNFGPLISVLPPALLALMQSPTLALGVMLLYLAIQLVESYLITPLILRNTVDLPPALTLAAQSLLGVFLGTVGLALAEPLTVAAFVLVKRIYVEGVIGDDLAASEAAEET